MGAGISDKDMKRIMYNRLKAVQRKLEKHGVPVTYSRMVLLHGSNWRGFSIRYGNILRASNGETAAFLSATVWLFGVGNTYGGTHVLSLDKGLDEIIKYFGKENQ